MALTETRPETETADALDSTPAITAVEQILGSGDHKATGRLWILSGSLMLLAGLGVSVVAGVEHVDLSGFSIVENQGRFSQLWSLGRELLLFGGIIPILIGLATYIVPLQAGSSSLAFPRGASAAFWSWFISIDLLIISYLLNGGPAGGRADYSVMWALALSATLLSIMWAMVCVATTMFGARATGMTLDRVPVSGWGFLVFSLGGLFVLPLLVAQLVIGYLSVKYGFLADRDARSSLLGVTDSVTLAPAVFWVGVPVLGMAAEAISVHSGSPLRFRKATMAALALLGITTFAAEIFTFAGGTPDFHNGVLVAGLIVTVVPVLAVLALAGESLKSGTFRLRTPLVAGLVAGLLLLLGTLVAVLGAVWPIVTFIEANFDTSVNLDSAFNVNNTSFHDGVRGLAMGAAVLGSIAGVHHWGHKIWGRSLDDRLGLLSVLAAAAGGLAWGIGGVVGGFLEQPRLPLVASDAKDGVEAMNGVAVAGMALLAAAALLLLANAVRTATGGGSANEPWSGLTLEWATTSPPVAANFDHPPVVSSALPLREGIGTASAGGDPTSDESAAAGDADSTSEEATE